MPLKSRESLERLTDIPNIGKAMERDLLLIDIQHPAGLIGKGSCWVSVVLFDGGFS